MTSKSFLNEERFQHVFRKLLAHIDDNELIISKNEFSFSPKVSCHYT